jgi:hypothetical protein
LTCWYSAATNAWGFGSILKKLILLITICVRMFLGIKMKDYSSRSFGRREDHGRSPGIYAIEIQSRSLGVSGR